MAVFNVPADASKFKTVAALDPQTFSIRFDNASLIVSRSELAQIMDAVAALFADVAFPIPDFPDDVPASLVEAQEVDE